MAVASTIITEALQDIAVLDQSGTTQSADSTLVLSRLNEMVGDWRRRGIPGLPASTIGVSTTIPDSLSEAVRTNLAIRIAPAYGSGAIAASESVRGRAEELFQALLNTSSGPASTASAGTAAYLVEDAAIRAGVIPEGQTLSTDRASRGLERLEALIADWNRHGVRGLPSGTVNAGTSISSSVYDAVCSNLALRLIEGSNPPEPLILQARSAYETLVRTFSGPATSAAAGTAAYLVEDAAIRAGVIPEGQALSADRASRGLERLEALIADWNRQGVQGMPSTVTASTTIANNVYDAVCSNLALRLIEGGNPPEPLILQARGAYEALVRTFSGPATSGSAGTAAYVVEDAAIRAGVIPEGQALSADRASRGLERLEGMLADWTRRGVSHGVSASVTASTSIGSSVYDAVASNLALRLIEGSNPSEALILQARGSYDALAYTSSAPASEPAVNTANWVVEDALIQAGVIPEGLRPSGARVTRGLARLNALLGDWNRRGINTGLTTPVSGSTTIGADVQDAIRTNLAVRVVEGDPSENLLARARLLYEELRLRSSTPAPEYEEGTWGWLMTDALLRAGVVSEGQNPSMAHVCRAWVYFRRMTEQWVLDGLLNHAPFHVPDYTLEASKLIYTIGEDDNADIPVRALSSVTTISLRLPFQDDYNYVVPMADYETVLRYTTRYVSEWYPRIAYYEPAWPVGCIYFDIAPPVGTIMSVTGRADFLDEGSSLVGPITLPNGYESAAIDSLTIDLATAYGLRVTPMMAQMQRHSLKLLRKRNHRSRLSVLPNAVLGDDVTGRAGRVGVGRVH